MSIHHHKEEGNANGTSPSSSCCGGHSEQQGADQAPALSASAVSGNALDDLKSEILNNINSQRRGPLPWGSVTVSIVLALLALISIVQTVQSASLYNKLKSGDLKPAVSPASGPAQNLPTQVGGC